MVEVKKVEAFLDNYGNLHKSEHDAKVSNENIREHELFENVEHYVSKLSKNTGDLFMPRTVDKAIENISRHWRVLRDYLNEVDK